MASLLLGCVIIGFLVFQNVVKNCLFFVVFLLVGVWRFELEVEILAFDIVDFDGLHGHSFPEVSSKFGKNLFLPWLP